MYTRAKHCQSPVATKSLGFALTNGQLRYRKIAKYWPLKAHFIMAWVTKNLAWLVIKIWSTF